MSKGSTYGSGTGGFTYGSTSSSSGHTQGGKKESGFTYGGISRGGAPTTGGKDVGVYRVGVQVKHPKFGVGVIVNARGVGGNKILDVAFEGLGIKQLSATLAPLTVLE